MTEQGIFSEQKFNIFNQPEVPSIVLCNPNKQELYAIDRLIYNMTLNLKYNALSEFKFTISKSIDGNLTTIKAYSYIKPKRLIKIDGIGYFIIITAEEEDDGSIPKLNVTCQSLESELLYKRLTGYEVTSVKFYTENDDSTLLQKMINLCPTWSVGTVSTELSNKRRSFSTNDTNIYSFLMNDVSRAYNCIFEFNTIEKTISAYLVTEVSQNNQTGIFLSYDNLVKNSTLSELSDELATALYGYGGNDLDIRPVNPMLGAVYNFDYYIQHPEDENWHSDWMSDELRNALLLWKERLILVEEGDSDTYFAEYIPYNNALSNVILHLDFTDNYLNSPSLANAKSLSDSKSILLRLQAELALIESKIKIEVNEENLVILEQEKTNKKIEIENAKTKVEYYAELTDKYIFKDNGSIYKVLTGINIPQIPPQKLSDGQGQIYKAIDIYKYFINVYKSELTILQVTKPINESAISLKKEQITKWRTYLNNAGGAEDTDSNSAKPYTLKVITDKLYNVLYYVDTNSIFIYMPFSQMVNNLRDCNYSIASYNTTLTEYRAEYAALEVSLAAAIEAKLTTDITSYKSKLEKKKKQIDNVSSYITDALKNKLYLIN